MNIPILIMAAGSSSRLGQAKQLLPFKGGTLISFVVRECLASHLGEVVVVVGSQAEKIKNEIQDLDCQIIFNKHWNNGLGSSIACGIKSLNAENVDGAVDGAIVVLVDQIFFSKTVLLKIKEQRSATLAPIISCSYREGIGPPTFFEAALFDELMQLNGEAGAKKVINRYFSKTEFVSFSQGHLDIDVPQDMERLQGLSKQDEPDRS